MLKVAQRTKFRRDYKRQRQRGKDIDKLERIVYQLSQGLPLPELSKPHKLSGAYAGLWECHVENDWLLIYHFTERELVLYRTGTHTDLFE
jgi:mRNA interferase YafQ